MKFFFLIPFIISTALFANNEGVHVQSELQSVTVYRNGAEMVHTASARLKAGNNEVLIGGVSSQIDINSVQVKTTKGLTVLGVEYTANYLGKTTPSERMKWLNDSLQRATKESQKLSFLEKQSTELLAVLNANKDIKGTQTGINVAELMKLMDFYKTKNHELESELASIKELKTKNTEAINQLRKQINEEGIKNADSKAVLVLSVNTPTEGKYDMTIDYITGGAQWQPFYEMRVDDSKSPIKMVFKAKVSQTTGIDWNNIKLSLSTSLPGDSRNAPSLNTWFVSIEQPQVTYRRPMPKMLLAVGKMKMKSAREEAENGAVDPAPQISDKEEQKSDGVADFTTVSDNALSVVYDIDIPYTIPSNGKEQLATVNTTEVKADYRHYSVPKLDADVYFIAYIPEWEKLNLLPGNANIIFEGSYVGQTYINPESTTDTLNLTLSKDRKVSIKREKLKDFTSTTFLSGYKSQVFTYETTIKNNKKDAVVVDLKDQYPVTTDKEITIELTENGHANVNTETGLLTWKVDLAPGESKKIRFSFKVKYPRDKVVNL